MRWLAWFLLAALAFFGPAAAQNIGPSGCGSSTNPCYFQGSASGSPVTVTYPATTYQGVFSLTANTSTALTSGNVTMTGTTTLPAPSAFARLVIIVPSACAMTANWNGGTASATSGEQMGSGTNVGTDTVNLTGSANAPTFFSTAGCTNVQFRN